MNTHASVCQPFLKELKQQELGITRAALKDLQFILAHSHDQYHLITIIRKGVSPHAVNVLARVFASSVEMMSDLIGITAKTLRNRKNAHKPLSKTESATAVKLLQVIEQATQLFDGDLEAAQQWLNTPALAFDGVKPIEILDTLQGVEAVLNLITALEYGVYV